jgi:hypothetical protein
MEFLSLYLEHRIFINIAVTLIAISLTLYFFINRRKQVWLEYYWKGFLLISLGGMLSLLKFLMELSLATGLIRKALVLIFVLYGFYLILLGAKKEKEFKRST